MTGRPFDVWVVQQHRAVTPCRTAPPFLIHDNDANFRMQFARMTAVSTIELLAMLNRTPRANTLCERFIGSVQRECLDHLLILHERHLQWALSAYVAYFNDERHAA